MLGQFQQRFTIQIRFRPDLKKRRFDSYCGIHLFLLSIPSIGTLLKTSCCYYGAMITSTPICLTESTKLDGAFESVMSRLKEVIGFIGTKPAWPILELSTTRTFLRARSTIMRSTSAIKTFAVVAPASSV